MHPVTILSSCPQNRQQATARKPAKVALATPIRKLIELANTLVKADRIWRPKGA